MRLFLIVMLALSPGIVAAMPTSAGAAATGHSMDAADVAQIAARGGRYQGPRGGSR